MSDIALCCDARSCTAEILARFAQIRDTSVIIHFFLHSSSEILVLRLRALSHHLG